MPPHGRQDRSRRERPADSGPSTAPARVSARNPGLPSDGCWTSPNEAQSAARAEPDSDRCSHNQREHALHRNYFADRPSRRYSFARHSNLQRRSKPQKSCECQREHPGSQCTECRPKTRPRSAQARRSVRPKEHALTPRDSFQATHVVRYRRTSLGARCPDGHASESHATRGLPNLDEESTKRQCPSWPPSGLGFEMSGPRKRDRGSNPSSE